LADSFQQNSILAFPNRRLVVGCPVSNCKTISEKGLYLARVIMSRFSRDRTGRISNRVESMFCVRSLALGFLEGEKLPFFHPCETPAKTAQSPAAGL
jgi:hypothetical protein